MRSGRLVLAAMVCLGGSMAACSSDSGGGGASSDAEVSECTGGRDSSNRIRVEATNSGSGTADYLVAVAQISERTGDRIGVVDVHVRAVRSGETGEDYAFGETYAQDVRWTCEIADVQRLER